MNEADTCHKFVIPALQQAGWKTEPRSIDEMGNTLRVAVTELQTSLYAS
jgi:type I site-specific restriction endonuclease